MIVFPAIDLKGGEVVRLAEGDMNRATVYADDPAAQAGAAMSAAARVPSSCPATTTSTAGVTRREKSAQGDTIRPCTDGSWP